MDLIDDNEISGDRLAVTVTVTVTVIRRFAAATYGTISSSTRACSSW